MRLFAFIPPLKSVGFLAYNVKKHIAKVKRARERDLINLFFINLMLGR
jgi:hypothetical protein